MSGLSVKLFIFSVYIFRYTEYYIDSSTYGGGEGDKSSSTPCMDVLQRAPHPRNATCEGNEGNGGNEGNEGKEGEKHQVRIIFCVRT